MDLTSTEKSDGIPPIILRGLAAAGGRLLTDDELCERTGWSRYKLRKISNRISWADVTHRDTDAFFAAAMRSWSYQKRDRWLVLLAIKRGGLHTLRHLQHGNCARQYLARVKKLYGNRS